MVIHAPKPRPVASGFWTFCDQTGDLRHADAHADSTVCTRWPLLDRWHRNLIERGVGWLLNAAGAGRERLDAALRVPYPGSRLDGLPAIQSAFWHRLLVGQSGGATAQLYLGNGQAGSSGGLVVSDSKDGNGVAGHGGGTKSASIGRAGGAGSGPGRGLGGESTGTNVRGGGGGGGGYAAAGTAGSAGSSPGGGAGGLAVPPGWICQAIVQNSYTAADLGMGGGGGSGGIGAGGRSRNAGHGGSAGDGLLRVSVTSITESTTRTLTGNAGGAGGSGPAADNRSGGGGGSGGLYLALCPGVYSLGEGITINMSGGAGGSAGSRAGAGGGGANGRVIICYGDSVDTSAGSISNAVPTTYQLLPSLPLGQVRVS